MRFTAPLFVPGDRPDRFEKALDSGATAVILDLEDAVAPEAKAQARERVVAALRERDALRAKTIVRINGTSTPFAADDLAALRALGIVAVMIPKCETPAEVRDVAAALPQTRIVAIVESIGGLDAARAIAAEPAITALALGVYDLSAQIGNQPTWEATAVFRTHVVVSARASGKAAIDAPFIAIDDESGLVTEAGRAVEFGFDGKLAIHPKHIAPLLRAFAPSPEEIEHARRVLAAAAGGGVAKVDGKMIDPPLVAAARRTLSRTTLGEHDA